MKIQEIAELNTTLVIDPDEARVLAAACTIAFLHCEGSEPTINALEEFGNLPLMGMYLEGLAAMFEAASMAGAAHFALNKPSASVARTPGFHSATKARPAMLLRSLGERAVVELDSIDCEILARVCRLAAGSEDNLSYNVENAACFFAAASAISRMHGWHNQPHDMQANLDALCARVEGAE